jgi:phage terminase large subunit-like protein
MKEVFAENRDPAPENEAERAKLLATLRRVVISVDPSGCSGEQDRRADEIGIIATGVGHDGIARVLEDATGRYAPHEWAIKTLERVTATIGSRATSGFVGPKDLRDCAAQQFTASGRWFRA